MQHEPDDRQGSFRFSEKPDDRQGHFNFSELVGTLIETFTTPAQAAGLLQETEGSEG